MKNPFKNIYFVTIIILLALGILGIILLNYKTTKDFGLNFLAEICGAFITIVIIDRLFKRHQEEKQNIVKHKIRAMLFSELSRFYFDFLPTLTKTESDNNYYFGEHLALASSPLRLDSENLKKIYEELGAVDFLKEYDIETFEQFEQRIDRFLQTYMPYLDEELIPRLLRLKDIVESLRHAKEWNKPLDADKLKKLQADIEKYLHFIESYSTGFKMQAFVFILQLYDIQEYLKSKATKIEKSK